MRLLLFERASAVPAATQLRELTTTRFTESTLNQLRELPSNLITLLWEQATITLLRAAAVWEDDMVLKAMPEETVCCRILCRRAKCSRCFTSRLHCHAPSLQRLALCQPAPSLQAPAKSTSKSPLVFPSQATIMARAVFLIGRSKKSPITPAT
jgi:hypothetical protein